MKRWLVIGALAAALAGCGPDESVPFNPNAAERVATATILRDASLRDAPQDEAVIIATSAASS